MRRHRLTTTKMEDGKSEEKGKGKKGDKGKRKKNTKKTKKNQKKTKIKTSLCSRPVQGGHCAQALCCDAVFVFFIFKVCGFWGCGVSE